MNSELAKKIKIRADNLPIFRLYKENADLKTDKGILQLEKGDLEAEIRELKTVIDNPRAYLAHRFLKGSGIEIGATYLPVKLPKGTNVKYVDEAPLEELYKRYPELKKLDMVPINIVDNGERLGKIKNNSQDFIIANHFLEHALDPIGTILNMYDKLKKNGFLFLAIPEKRYTFDINRPVTPYSHLVDEHKNPSFEKKWQHLLEVARILDKKRGADIETDAKRLLDTNYSIHYHVWTQIEMTEMFQNIARDFNVNLEIIVQLRNEHEVINLLQKGLKQKGYRGKI